MSIRLHRRHKIPIVVFCLAGAMQGQTEKKNPVAGDPTAIREGASLFRANCSPCHGLNAQGGGRGPDLTAGRWLHGGSDEAIFQTISHGVLGTEMPGSSFEDGETWALIAFIRSRNANPAPPPRGNASTGEKLFSGKSRCAACHMVEGHGGHLGPDLSRVGAARSVAYLGESIREPDKELSAGYYDPNNHYGIQLEYDTTVILTRDGKRLSGVAKNEDAFTVQLLDEDDQLHLFLKKDLAEIRHERRSLMPAYTPEMLSTAELDDLVSYLVTLRGGGH